METFFNFLAVLVLVGLVGAAVVRWRLRGRRNRDHFRDGLRRWDEADRRMSGREGQTDVVPGA